VSRSTRFQRSMVRHGQPIMSLKQRGLSHKVRHLRLR
jgi:hypothetical protein